MQEERSGATGGTGIPIKSLREDARRLSAEDFEERHGSAFLLHSAPARTNTQSSPMTEVDLGRDDEPAAARTADISLLAYPILHAPYSPGHLVTVGRSSRNDIVIPDPSISRLHAYLKPLDGERLAIQDAGSTNGTTLNGSSIPAKHCGPPADLKSGDNLRLGQVELTVLSAQALRDFALAHQR